MDSRIAALERIRAVVKKRTLASGVVDIRLTYPEVTGIIAVVSQHLYNMKWEHLMEAEPDPAPVGLLQTRWHTLYRKALQAQSDLAMNNPIQTAV